MLSMICWKRVRSVRTLSEGRWSYLLCVAHSSDGGMGEHHCGHCVVVSFRFRHVVEQPARGMGGGGLC
jgi:hypothetical protein